jgi:hypothetical protein
MFKIDPWIRLTKAHLLHICNRIRLTRLTRLRHGRQLPALRALSFAAVLQANRATSDIEHAIPLASQCLPEPGPLRLLVTVAERQGRFA